MQRWTAIAESGKVAACLSQGHATGSHPGPHTVGCKGALGVHSQQGDMSISGCVSAPHPCVDNLDEIPAAVRAALAEIVREGARREKPRAAPVWAASDYRRLPQFVRLASFTF